MLHWLSSLALVIKVQRRLPALALPSLHLVNVRAFRWHPTPRKLPEP